MKLRWRVLLTLAIAVTVPVLIVGAMAIWRARSNVKQEVDAGALAHIRAIGAGLDVALQDARRTVEFAAAEWADAMAGAVPANATTNERRIRRLRRSVPMLASVSFASHAGTLLAGDALPPGVELGRDSFGGYVGDVVQVNGRATVFLVVQARSRTGELVGVVACALDLDFVRARVSAARLGPGARMLVLDSDGTPIASSDGTRPDAQPAVDHALQLAQADIFEGTFEQQDWVTAYRNLSGFQSQCGVNWVIVHQQPTADAYRLARATARDTVVVGVVALGLALFVGGWFANRLTRPLTALAQRADAIAQARGGSDPSDAPTPNATTRINGPGEIGVLAKRLDEMAERVAERAHLQAALARGDRLASVGVMSAQLAHEINNPLTTVMGYAQLLLEDKPAEHPDHAGLQLIADEAERMKKIVGALLRYARAESVDDQVSGGNDNDCDLQATVGHAVSLALPQLRKSALRVSTEVAPGLRVTIAGRALEQVLVNLLQNAIHATNGSGTIRITGRPTAGDVAAEIIVSDDWPGVPTVDRQRIFDPFFSTKQAAAGTGLGLAVCKHLISTAGGSIELREPSPEYPRGATFAIMLPLHREPT
ncbi:MAG TPA: sensor histidine kinase [Kofleriaceae bacterium]|nr:sensor histidine kinase [Kofleriaceae bacterium]